MKRELLEAGWIGLVAVAIFSGSWISECMAAPLLLRGTATIATVYDDYQYEGLVRRLPFAALVGDSFQFYLSIEPQPFEPDRPSGFAAFRSTIGGVQLEHNQLEVVVANDSGVDVLTLARPRVVDMMAIEGDGIFIRRDYRLGNMYYVGTTNVPGGLDFQLDLGFLESHSAGHRPYPAILNDVSIPQDETIWQAFSAREIALWFENTTFVGAYINEMVIVPEPSAAVVAGIGWSLIVFCFRPARRQRL